jgi:hypothetical protein
MMDIVERLRKGQYDMQDAASIIVSQNEELDRLRAENAEKTQMIANSIQKLDKASEETGIYAGCDTPDELAAEIITLRAENAAQALLIASLKELVHRAIKQRDMWDQANTEARQQLSDTQRQNAELMQRVGEAEKDAERYREARLGKSMRVDCLNKHGKDVIFLIGGREEGVNFPEQYDEQIDAAIAASKVSNEKDTK